MLARRSPRASRRIAFAVVCSAALLLSSEEGRAAPSAEQCVSANETAQSLRRSGKLRDARARLLVCAAKECPRVVRDDCAERLADFEAAVPTIVFAAKGDRGVDLVDVEVSMDGVPLTKRLDGAALEIDPGPHTFELRAAGYAPAQTKLVIREGVKRRQEIVTMSSLAGTAPSKPSEEPKAEGGSSQRVLGYALGGVGLVGLGLGTFFGLKAGSTYDDASSKTNCPTSTTCNDAGVEGGKDAHAQATVSTIAFVAGGALLAGGIVLVLTSPKDAGLQVQASANGIRLGGVW